jgi:hypothetical protein
MKEIPTTPLQTPQQSLRAVKSVVSVLRNLRLHLFFAIFKEARPRAATRLRESHLEKAAVAALMTLRRR